MQWEIILILVALIFIAILPIIIAICKKIVQSKREANIRETIHKLAHNQIELTPQEFFDIRNCKGKRGAGTGKYALNYNFEGVYIIFNKTKQKYYVGQAREILNRVNNHFTGKGNGDIYADYKYGDVFTIKMISLKSSGYDDINKLEYDTIKSYNAFSKGYNKTSGNKCASSLNYKNLKYDCDVDYEIDDEIIQKSRDWQKNKSYYAKEIRKAKEKIKVYALNNNDWQMSNKNLRINFFYLNEKFYYKKAATWPEFCDNNIKFTNSPLPKATIESIIEPIYKNKFKKE